MAVGISAGPLADSPAVKTPAHASPGTQLTDGCTPATLLRNPNLAPQTLELSVSDAALVDGKGPKPLM